MSNENYIELRNEVASIKDLGKKIFSIHELHQDNIEGLMSKLLGESYGKVRSY